MYRKRLEEIPGLLEGLTILNDHNPEHAISIGGQDNYTCFGPPVEDLTPEIVKQLTDIGWRVRPKAKDIVFSLTDNHPLR